MTVANMPGGLAMHDGKRIKDAVRQRYGTLAATGETCQGTRSGSSGTGRTCGLSYSPEELASLDPEVGSMGLGWGNPVSLAELRGGEFVLDLGSGGGIDVFLAARLVGPTGKAIGVDMTEEMLQRARRAAAAMGIANAEFRHGEIEALPLQDKSVDVVISNCVVNLALDKSRVFRETFRVLKPGGRMVVSDVVSNGPLLPSIRTDPEAWAGCVGGALEERKYLDLIQAAGFEEVEVLSRQQAAPGEA
jgi:arsenite methyltransferase